MATSRNDKRVSRALMKAADIPYTQALQAYRDAKDTDEFSTGVHMKREAGKSYTEAAVATLLEIWEFE